LNFVSASLVRVGHGHFCGHLCGLMQRSFG
jgi:hypothetical protein